MTLSPTAGHSCSIDTWRDPSLDAPASPTPPASRIAPDVDMSAGYPRGDGRFADSVRGTAPQPQRDLQLSLMANDVYADRPGGIGPTGTAAEAELASSDIVRLQAPAGADHLVDPDGNIIPISPTLLHDPNTGFDAAIYQTAEGQYVVAYRGTDSWFGENGLTSDSPTNAGQGIGLETRAYSQAVKLAEEAVKVFGEGNVVVTGQSLGGGKASAAAVANGIPAVTFNASGLSNNTLRSFDLNPNAAREALADNGQIRRYVIDGEPLTALQQDIPVVPVPFVGPVSPPDAVGTELRIDPPAGMSRTDFKGLHGGGGDGASYVEALRENVARPPVDPLAGTDTRLLLDTLQNGGELHLNQIGNLVRFGMEATGSVADAYGDTRDAIGEVVDGDIADGRYVQGGVRIAGDVVDGLVDGAGSLGNDALDALGGSVENAANFGGAVLRDVGDFTRLEAPFDAVAGVVENGGHLVNRGLDATGNGVQWTADRIGDGAEWTLDRAGEGLQWAADRTVDAAVATADAAVWAGGKVVEGAQWTGERIVEGATWAGDRIADGANAVADGARWAAEKANPFNWFR